MTTDEAKGLFALMGWKWEAKPLAHGNKQRGNMDAAYQNEYEVFVNEVMVDARQRSSDVSDDYSEYERYAVDRCLTKYAELYAACVAEGGFHGTRPYPLSIRSRA